MHTPAGRRPAAHHRARLWRRGSGTVAAFLVLLATRDPHCSCPQPESADALAPEVPVYSSAPCAVEHALRAEPRNSAYQRPAITQYWTCCRPLALQSSTVPSGSVCSPCSPYSMQQLPEMTTCNNLHDTAGLVARLQSPAAAAAAAAAVCV